MKELERRLGRFGIMPGLERIEKICEALGRPQDRLRVVLVTGTNGKGSITAALASMLTAAGYRTGSYFSPHLARYNERIRIDGREIADDEFAPYERKLLEMHDRGQEMTLFEALTAIAYAYFADRGCEFAVMEIGMGGRYDATNIAMEEAAVISNAELEHTEYLGETVAKIALDKARIIKNPKCFAVTGCSGIALDAVKARAGEVGARLMTRGKDFKVTVRETKIDGTVFDYERKGKIYERLSIPLAGKHQAANAALAIAVAEGLGTGETAIRNGLAKVEHRGRLQIIGRSPLVIADGAHNPAGVRTLVGSLDLFPREKLVCVFTALKDKDWRTMLSLLGPKCDLMVINQLPDARAESAGKIAAEAKRYAQAVVVKGVKESVELAKSEAGKRGMVLICGSLYMLGQVPGVGRD
jgi:dihydrofolate synthase/folylpolyglutamate synthase